MPEPELRRLKSIAASRGVSLQSAVHEALEAWTAETRKLAPEPLDALEGSLAGVDVDRLRREEKELESADDRPWL